MPVLTVRNLPDATCRALKLRAAKNGRSTEAEIREILTAAITPSAGIKIGSALADFGRRHGGLDLDRARDHSPIEPAAFE